MRNTATGNEKMSGECDKCGEHALCNCPTVITREDVDKFFEKLMTDEIKEKKCFSCGKGFYFDSYGSALGECDECWFSRFPKEQVEEFYRSFF